MRFALVDLDIPGRKANRDHAGGFGAQVQAAGLAGRVVARLKESLVDIPVMSLGFCAALLRGAGHEAVFSRGELAGEDVILVASSIHCHKEELAFAREARRRFPASRIGFFGALATTRPEIFEPDADFVVLGEVESALLDFLEGKRELSGRVEAGIVEDMDRLPVPDWRGLDIGRCSYFPLLLRRPVLTVQSSRGCPHRCEYCSYMPLQTKRYRHRDPGSVVREMAQGVERHGVRGFLFRDICFTLNRGRVLRLLEAMRAAGLRVDWACETRVDCLDPELIDIMRDHGLCGVNLGIESPNLDILGKAGKNPPSLEHQEKVLRHLEGRGIRVNAFYILGLEGDTPESMARTIGYAERMNTMGAQFSILTPFPGTPIFERLAPRLLTGDFSRFNEYEPVVDIGTASPAEVLRAAARAQGYYFRPAWMAKHGPAVLRGLLARAAGRG